jgi:hypothetical protein
MSMYVLSETQFDQISKALEAARFALETSQHVQLDLTKTKQTIPLPAGEKIVRASSAQKPKSQSKTRKSSRKGRRGVAVLNEGQVLEIKQQIASGTKSVAKIARDFGVHVTTINCIKAGKTWKHVQLQQPAAVVVAD